MIVKSQSEASPNHASHQYFDLYALSIACFHHKQQLLMYVAGAVMCPIIVCNAVSFVQILSVMLFQSSFDKYNVKKSPTENVCFVFHCAFVLSFIIQVANHLVTVNVSAFFAVIFTISLFVTTSFSTCSKHATVSASHNIHSHAVIEIDVALDETFAVNSDLKLFLFAYMFFHDYIINSEYLLQAL